MDSAYSAGADAALEKLGMEKDAFLTGLLARLGTGAARLLARPLMAAGRGIGAAGRGIGAAGRGIGRGAAGFKRYWSGGGPPKLPHIPEAPAPFNLASEAAGEAGDVASGGAKTLWQRFNENKGSVLLNAGFGVLGGDSAENRLIDGGLMGAGAMFGPWGQMAGMAATQLRPRSDPTEPPGPY